MDISAQVYRMDTHSFVKSLKDLIKEQDIQLPKNLQFLKSGFGKQYVPMSEDWYLTRTASIFRQVLCKGRVSLTGLGFRYGNRKNRGVKPSKFAPASKFIIASAIENLEKLGWIDFKSTEHSILTEAGKTAVEPLLSSEN